MKIYTKTGDDGTTSLFSGGRVLKTNLRVESYGTIDELNSVLGVVRASQPSPRTDGLLGQIQRQLFNLGADLATPLDAKADWVVRMDAETVAWVESQIDALTVDLPPLKNFILPGGSLAAAHIHVARTICRRAERIVVELQTQERVGEQVIHYLNRLSDFLFTLARWENLQQGIPEDTWTSR
jgi:cob(I)alamin adenosyltransferase